MILERFREIEGFPFENYFADVNEYIQAQLYWTEIVQSTPSFAKEDWSPIPESESLDADMQSGRMIWLNAVDGRKQIMLHMTSVEGLAQMLIADNPGVDAKAEDELRTVFGADFPIDDTMRQPLSQDEARRIAQAERSAQPVKTWVEQRAPWVAGDLPIERLYLTAEISEQAEPQAILALNLFMQPGAAFERVNSVFATED